MSDTSASTDNDTVSARDALDSARQTGRWMLWSGFGSALLWWGGAAGGLIGLLGLDTLAGQPAGTLVAGAVLVLLPGLMMLMAGLMAQQNKRANAANALVLQAADNLLAPARTAKLEVSRLAEATRASTEAINRTATETLTSLKAISDNLSNERLRAESVTYAMADNARDLTRRLTDERIALQELAKSLDLQARTLNDAIPRQASAMAEAAKQAGEEVAEADLALEKRLHQLKTAGSTLAVRLSDLDAVAKDATSRTEALSLSIARIEDKLGQSQKTVEMAERASAMAVDAATTVGHSLRDAVSAALDGARDANNEISLTTRKVQEDAARTLAELRLASHEAGAAAADASRIARQSSPQLATPALRPKSSADTTINGHAGTNGHDGLNGRARPGPELPLRPAGQPDRPLPAPSAPTAGDEDLFDTAAAGDIAIESPNADTTPPPPTATKIKDSPTAPLPKINGSDQGSEWRDIIADMEDDEVEMGAASEVSTKPLPREETAERLIDRLETSGIPLPTTFKPRDKKKIAAAARKDDKTRRSAIRHAAGNEVDRVALRLRKDEELMLLARHFVIAEEGDALQTLADTSGSKRPASSRLSAYLLVDAALEAAARA